MIFQKIIKIKVRKGGMLEKITTILESIGLLGIIYGAGVLILKMSITNKFETKLEEYKTNAQKDLERLKFSFQRQHNNLSELNKEQRAVLSIYPKFLANYYDKEELEPPKMMPTKYTSKYKKIQKDLDSFRLQEKLIHAVYEFDFELGNKFMGATNPITAFNALILETAISVDTVKIITYHMNSTYTGRYNSEEYFEGISNPQFYIHSLLYKTIIQDYKQIVIPDETLLKFIFSDFDKIDINNFAIIREKIGINNIK